MSTRNVFEQYEDQHPGYDASEEFYAAIGSSMKTQEDWDVVNNPKHYQKNGMEVIDIIEAFTPDSYSYCMGNAIKYLMRHMDKARSYKRRIKGSAEEEEA